MNLGQYALRLLRDPRRTNAQEPWGFYDRWLELKRAWASRVLYRSLLKSKKRAHISYQCDACIIALVMEKVGYELREWRNVAALPWTFVFEHDRVWPSLPVFLTRERCIGLLRATVQLLKRQDGGGLQFAGEWPVDK